MYNYGDIVKIISSGAIGEICDISKKENSTSYIIDCHDYIDSNKNDADNWLIEATEQEIKLAE